jgi:hypothetical protein
MDGENLLPNANVVGIYHAVYLGGQANAILVKVGECLGLEESLQYREVRLEGLEPPGRSINLGVAV